MHHMMKAGKSMWPLFYCIMNFPPSLRHVPHVGMHMAGFDLGAMCSLDIFADELLQLWDKGFVVDGQQYKVFLIEILTDSRGREKLMKVQGAGSKAGCSKCEFEGRTFGRSQVYDRWRRYLPADDPRRRKNTALTSTKQVCTCAIYVCDTCSNCMSFCVYVYVCMQYHCLERERPPREKDYDFYVNNARRAMESGEVSNGVKGFFPFYNHPHANLSTATTDYMHGFYNHIHDLIW